MPLVHRIKAKFPHARLAGCKESGCELRLRSLKNHIVLKGEKLCQGRRMSDCVIFVEGVCLIIGIVELKSKTIHATEVLEKLTNTSDVALNVLGQCRPAASAQVFYHLVLAKRWRTSEYKVITRRRVMVSGKKYHVIPARCGTSFSAVISKLR